MTVLAGSKLAGSEDLTIVTSTTPLLSVASTHFGNFSPGQTNAIYTLIAANRPFAPATSGPVTVTDVLPAGLSFMSMAGAGWTCPSTACTRSDPLNGGANYPPITVTVNVAANTDSQVVNQANAAGSGSPPATGNDPTTIGVNLCAVTQDGNASVSDIQEVVNEALGATPPVHDLNGDTVVSIVDVQIVMNAAVRMGCSVR